MVEISIHEQSCRGCELCVDVCPTKVFESDKELRRPVIRYPEDCIACLSCAYICPSGALSHDRIHLVKNFYRDLTFCEKMERFL